MTKVGQDALNALNSGGSEGNSNKFTSFKTGTTYIVKVLGTTDLMSYDSYGIFKKVDTFAAENPSKKSKAGYPIENLTPWDKAWKYHVDKSEKFQDEHSVEARKYRPKQRFVMGFFDLDSGEQIAIDVSKKQAQALHGSIMKNEKRLDTFAFELSKEGEDTSTIVSLTPMLDDMTKEQQKNFDNAPSEFNQSKFEGILYEMNEDEQIEKLIEAGFDISLIGLVAPTKEESSEEPEYDF